MEEIEKKIKPPHGNGSHYIEGQTSALIVGESYSYTCVPADGYSYWWTVLGGTITSGQETATINVTWGDPGSGVIQMNVISDIVVVDTGLGGNKPK